MAAREEDKAMAGLLRRSLAQGAGPGSGEECPGPEILAAYFDRALDEQETARYDLHFSRCSTCREQLAAMARAGDAPDVKDAQKKTAGAWDWLMDPRWLMPAAAMLVALVAITGIALRMRKPVAPANEIAMSQPEALPSPSSEPLATSVPAPEAAPPQKVAPPATRENPVGRPTAPSPRDAASAAIVLSESQASHVRGATSAAGANAGVSHAHAPVRRDELSVAGAANANPPVGQTAPQPRMMSRLKSPAMDRGAMRAGSGGGVSAETTDSADATANVTENVQALDAMASAPTPPVPAKPADKKAEAGSVESDTNVAVQTDEAKESNAAKTKLPETAAP
jgi:hypothetical protein